ncbi:MAG: LapA family protein [Candidatus Omnitrophota bacterium]
MGWKWVLILILLLLLVIFTTQNYEIVEIKFLFWSFKTSRAIIIFSTLLIGIVIGSITALIKRI